MSLVKLVTLGRVYGFKSNIDLLSSGAMLLGKGVYGKETICW